MIAQDELRDQYDAIVVGARCAGAATALRMAQQGMRVLAVDRSPYGSDTRSTHALMRPAIHLLSRWGVLDRLRAAGTPRVRTTTFHYEDGAIEVPIKEIGDLDGLYAPRRTVLDAALVDAARARGAEVHHEVRVRGLIRDDAGRVGGVVLQPEGGRVRRVRAPLVIGADGMRSGFAKWVGASAYRRWKRATAGFYAYYRGLDIPDYHWHFAREIGAGTIPTNDDLTLAFVSVTPERFERELHHDRAAGFLRVLREVDPALGDAIAGARQEGPLYGFPAEPGFMRVCAGPGWALVGDAGYFRDPLTAHGITDALIGAELLAAAAVEGTARAFADYQATRDELCLPLAEVTDEIAGLAWDQDEVKVLHKRLSAEMKRELEFLERRESAAPFRSSREPRRGPIALAAQ